MTSTKSRYRKLTDLYVTGRVLEMQGEPLWVQPLNSFDQEEARRASRTSKARVVLALEEMGSDELARFQGQLAELGSEGLVNALVASKAPEWMAKVAEELEDDPDWKERLEIVYEQAGQLGEPETMEEKELLAKINMDYLEEVGDRLEVCEKDERRRLGHLGEPEICEEFKDLWILRQANDRALDEFQRQEVLRGSRVCDGIRSDENWDHAACDHSQRAFEPSDVADMPDEPFELISQVIHELNLTVREAKNSERQGSSSDSSPLPSEPEGSAASTQEGPSTTSPGS